MMTQMSSFDLCFATSSAENCFAPPELFASGFFSSAAAAAGYSETVINYTYAWA